MGIDTQTDSIAGSVEKIFDQRYRELIRTQIEASERIAKNTGVPNPQDVLRAFYGQTHFDFPIYSTDLVVTDKVDKFLPLGDFYHVTTSKAPKYLSLKNVLLPTAFHELDVLTHRGKAQEISERFMRCLGIPESGAAFPQSSLGFKQMFIFASPEGDIDGQAFAIEDAIAKRSPRVNDEMFNEVFFDSPSNPQHLNHNLIKIIEKLREGKNITDQNLLEYISKLQNVLFQTLGIRFNWYDRIGQILRGEIKTPRIEDGKTIENLLLMPTSNYYKYGDGPDDSARAVILKIDRKIALGDRQIAILPLDDRNPRRVAMLPKISPDSVTVYSESKESAHGLPWKPLSDLSNKMYINGVRPNGVDLRYFKPSKALCGNRYGDDPRYARDVVKLWREPIEKGEVVSLGGLLGNYLDNDHTHLTNILRSILDPDDKNPLLTNFIIFDYGFPRFGSHLEL